MRRSTAVAIAAGLLSIMPMSYGGAAAAPGCAGGQGGSDEGSVGNAQVVSGADGVIRLSASESSPGCSGSDPSPAAPAAQSVSGSGSDVQCTFQDLTALSLPSERSDPVSDAELAAKREAGQRFIYEACNNAERTNPTFRGYWVDPAAPAAAGGPTRAAFEEAARSVVLPGPRWSMWPAPEAQVVNVDTWLHVDSDRAEAIPFEAPLSADVSTTNVLVTAQATATNVVWRFTGDAESERNPVSCSGPGAVWAPGADEGNPARCAVRFHKSGSGTATVTISYTVFWVGTTGEYGWVTAERTSPPFPFRVRAFEAVIR